MVLSHKDYYGDNQMTHKDIFKDSFPQDKQIGHTGSHYCELEIKTMKDIQRLRDSHSTI